MTTTAAPDRFDTTAERGARTRTSGPTAARERLVSLDVFRGMTVAGMLLVNNPGSWAAIYPPLEHAAWHGWTPTDLIFPFFLFIVGITTQLSLGARRERGDDDRALVRQVLRRGALIFLFGFLMSLFPGWQWGPVANWPTHFDFAAEPGFWQRVVYRWENVRIMGVLQRIGVAYTIGALLTLRTTLKQQVAIVAAALLGYWFAMTLIPVPGQGGAFGATLLDQPDKLLSAWLDRAILGVNHLWIGSRTWDPEGLLSTIPAICTVILGNMVGRVIGLRRPLAERLNAMFAAGAIAMTVGLMWNWAFPINKSIWTSSYVLFTGGMACVTLATCMWIVDVQKVSGWTKPFVVYGVNPMVAFVGSGVMARLIYSIVKVTLDGRQTSLENAIYQTAFASWLSPVNASLAFALTFVLFWLGILWILWRKRIFLKV